MQASERTAYLVYLRTAALLLNHCRSGNIERWKAAFAFDPIGGALGSIVVDAALFILRAFGMLNQSRCELLGLLRVSWNKARPAIQLVYRTCLNHKPLVNLEA